MKTLTKIAAVALLSVSTIGVQSYANAQNVSPRQAALVVAQCAGVLSAISKVKGDHFNVASQKLVNSAFDFAEGGLVTNEEALAMMLKGNQSIKNGSLPRESVDFCVRLAASQR